jgi:hypothetical protein
LTLSVLTKGATLYRVKVRHGEEILSSFEQQ